MKMCTNGNFVGFVCDVISIKTRRIAEQTLLHNNRIYQQQQKIEGFEEYVYGRPTLNVFIHSIQ